MVLVGLVLVAYFFYGLQPLTIDQQRADASSEGQTAPTVEFRIVKNDGFRSIAAQLSRASLIKSIAVFKLYALITGKAQRFQPGVYQLSSVMSIPEIVRTLTTGGSNEATVTIPEGLTTKDVETILVRAGVLGEQSLSDVKLQPLGSRYKFLSSVSSLEGFLFPDTYRFGFGASPQQVVETMLGNFEEKAWPLLMDGSDWYDRLILASFLEREVPESSDRQLVAGLLLKRLKLGMPLQVDATVSYVKCDGQYRDCPQPTIVRSDTLVSSPYNTYQRLGWTPTPIANPGVDALKAALNPIASPYLYYLSVPLTKQTLFSKTLAEHNAKKSKYLAK